MMSQKEFIDHIFLSDGKAHEFSPIEYAVWKSHSLIVKHLFDKKEVQDRYKNNDPMIFKLLLFLFVLNSSSHITEYVLSALDISKEKVIKMLSYECPNAKEVGTYHNFKIMTNIVWDGTFDHFQRFIYFVGEQAFIDNVFHVDKYRCDAMSRALCDQKMKVIEHILSFAQIKEKYLSDNNLLHYLCETLNRYIEYKECVQCIVDTLGLTEAKLSELNEFRAIDIEKIIPFTK